MTLRAFGLYDRLYSRGAAAALVILSGSVLAVSQTHVIRDWLAVLHPGWAPAWLWVNAAGFELVVLAVGLVLAMTGRRVLWVSEVFLILVSCGAAWDSMPAGTSTLRAVLASVMPLQYLAAVLAGNYLADRAEIKTRTRTTRADNPAPQIATMPATTERSVVTKRDIARGHALTPDRYAELAASHVPPGTPATRADSIIADIVGTSTKTAQRARLADASVAGTRSRE